MQYCFIYAFMFVVELFFVFIAYLIREYWYNPYGGFWDGFIPFCLMLSMLCTCFVVWLYSSRYLVHCLDYVLGVWLESFS